MAGSDGANSLESLAALRAFGLPWPKTNIARVSNKLIN